MQIFNKFTYGPKTIVQSVYLDKEEACIVISESDGETCKELSIDIAGAEALRDAIRNEIDEADESEVN